MAMAKVPISFLILLTNGEKFDGLPELRHIDLPPTRTERTRIGHARSDPNVSAGCQTPQSLLGSGNTAEGVVVVGDGDAPWMGRKRT